MALSRLKDEGQATVGLVVVLPVVIAVALVACNAVDFFSECARFDRLARNAIRICATSPSYGHDVGACAAAAEALVDAEMELSNISCSLVARGSGGHVQYCAKLEYYPKLLGMNMRSEVFGVHITPLTHEISLVVDPYDPGVLI